MVNVHRAANVFSVPESEAGFDRAAPRRRDEAFMTACRRDPAALLLPWWRGRLALADADDGTIALAPVVNLDGWLDAADEYGSVFLGLLEGTPLFALDVSALDQPESLPVLSGIGAFETLRRLAALLPPGDAHLAAYTHGMMQWHQTHRFCCRCGSPTRACDGGHVRRCTGTGCDAEHFPRTDPAVIMLVHDGEGGRVLLGRAVRFAEGLVSVLAGFVEPGESLEDAVAREVWEEAGVRVTDIRYHSSQPWPFPASLMLGFIARAVTTDISLASGELEEAAWYTREEVAGIDDASVTRLPQPFSVARRLIGDWLTASHN